MLIEHLLYGKANFGADNVLLASVGLSDDTLIIQRVLEKQRVDAGVRSVMNTVNFREEEWCTNVFYQRVSARGSLKPGTSYCIYPGSTGSYKQTKKEPH